MARFFSIDWIEAAWPISDDEYDDRKLPLKHLVEPSKGRPVIVYLETTLDDEKKEKKARRKRFGNEDLILGTKFFDCYRINADDLDEDLYRPYVKKLPAIIVFDETGAKVATKERVKNAKKLLRAVGKVFKKTYRASMKSRVKSLLDVIAKQEKVEDRVANTRRRLDDLKKRFAKKPSPRVKLRLEEQQAELASALEEKKKFADERAQLLRPETKDLVAKGN